MSFKTIVQLIIILLIGFIISLVYYNYFSVKNDIDQNTKEYNEEKIIEEKIIEEKNLDSNKKESKTPNKSNKNSNESEKSILKEENIKSDTSKINDKNNQEDKEEISNILKEVEYLTIDNKGNILWTRKYGSQDEDDWGWSVFETLLGNLVFVGSTKSYGASLFDIYLVGTNEEGYSQ